MSKSRLIAGTLAGLLVLAAGAVTSARAVAEPEGCCCIGGAGPEHCTKTTEKACLARQQAVPQYDEKTKYDEALKKSETGEAGRMTSGWKEGECPPAK